MAKTARNDSGKMLTAIISACRIDMADLRRNIGFLSQERAAPVSAPYERTTLGAPPAMNSRFLTRSKVSGAVFVRQLAKSWIIPLWREVVTACPAGDRSVAGENAAALYLTKNPAPRWTSIRNENLHSAVTSVAKRRRSHGRRDAPGTSLELVERVVVLKEGQQWMRQAQALLAEDRMQSHRREWKNENQSA